MVQQALTSQIDELFGYVQERFLWQFYSRSWDRSENIDGITNQAERLLLGQPALRETPAERLQAVDAKIMVDDFKQRFEWIKEASPEQIRALMRGLQEKLTDVAITRSKNHELSHSLY